jgi:hypothetical protein
VTAFCHYKKPDKEGLLKLSWTVFIVTTFSESQNRHKWSHLWQSQCDGFCKIKAGRHKKSQKELAKTSLLKLSKTSRIVTAFNRHKTESQIVTIVTVTMRYLGCFCAFVKKDKSYRSLYVELFIAGKPELLVNAEKNIKVTIEKLGLKVFVFILIEIISG